jgi:TolB-like protein/Tfp pilus assembly protein PilF
MHLLTAESLALKPAAFHTGCRFREPTDVPVRKPHEFQPIRCSVGVHLERLTSPPVADDLNIRISTLARLKISAEESELTSLMQYPLPCAVLVCLGVEREAAREPLATLFWPDNTPVRARHNLSQTLYRLKRELGGDWLKASGDRFVVSDAVHVDAVEFERLVNGGKYEEALPLYRGAFLGGTYLVNTAPFESWVDNQRSRLERLHRRARREIISTRTAASDLNAALVTAREWVEVDRLDDEAQHQVIELLAKCGRRSEALQQFDAYERLLLKELEVEPLDETKELIRRLRAGDDLSVKTKSGVSTPPKEGPATPNTSVVETRQKRKIKRETPPNSIAILPFVNLSGDPEKEYFSDGITDELINALAKVDEIQAAARTSSFAFKGKSRDVRTIGRLLNVRWIVEGSVRKAGEHIRIAVQLIKAADGFELWGASYDREFDDIFAIQEEISRSIVDALKLRIRAPVEKLLVKRYTDDPEAYNLYLFGRFLWNTRRRDGLERAVSYFEQALAKDPDYALAYSGIADAYLTLAQLQYVPPRQVLPKAEEASRRALELDPDRSETHMTYGHILDCYYWDWSRAEREYVRALELDPRSSLAHILYAELLTALGRYDEAQAHSEMAKELDPLSFVMAFQQGCQLYRARRYDLASAELSRTLEMEPNYFPAYVFLGLTHAAQGNGDKAIDIMQNALSRLGELPVLLTVLGYAYGCSGRIDEARDVLKRLDALTDRHYVLALYYTVVYAGIRDLDAAFDWLDRSFDERHGQSMYLNVDPVYDALRADIRFDKALMRLGLKT